MSLGRLGLSSTRRRQLFPFLLLTVLSLCLPALAGAQSDPALVGEWSAVQPWPEAAVHAHLLPTGKVLFWGHTNDDLYLWNPEDNTVMGLGVTPYGMMCAGHSFLPNGQLLIAGTFLHSGASFLPNASLYDPATNSWTRLPDMSGGRWYPTVTTLGSGEVLVAAGAQGAVWSGSEITLVVNPLPQVWQPATQSWRDLTTARQDLGYSAWMYAWMFLAPSGKVFYAGPTGASGFLDTSGTGSWSFLPPGLLEKHEYGSVVMYGEGKTLVVGGHDDFIYDAPTATAEVIDLSSPTPSWRRTTPMTYPRVYPNATLLPDGTVLVIGGENLPASSWEPVLTPELWDPSTESWTLLAPHAVFRGFHSLALLLPDAHVLVAGGDDDLYSNAEIFSPPYLFRGPRPTVTSMRSTVTYGQTFFAGTPEAADIAKVTWLRLPSVTHGFDQNVRFNQLPFSPTAGGINITAPADPNRCPPGHYMLFLLNGQGVPSVAQIVRIEAATGLPPPRPLDLVASPPVDGRVELRWTDNSSNEEGFLLERSEDGVRFVEIAALAANATAYADSAVAPCDAYVYRVGAYNLAGESSYSNAANAMTLASAGDFCLSVPPGMPTSASINAGETARFFLTLVPGGNPLSVSLGCTSLPPSASCVFSPATVSVDGQAAAEVILDVATEARSLLVPIRRGPKRNWEALPNLLLLLLLLVTLTTARALRRFPQLRGLPVPLFAVLLFCLSSLSCGSGDAAVSAIPLQGTPSGLHALRVTASTGSQSKEITLTLQVN